MDYLFMQEQLPLYLQAAVLTLRIAFIGVAISLIIGLGCATIQYFHLPVLRNITACYIELSRNTPLLIQLFFLYFGLPKIGIVLSSESCAIAGLSFLGGSYMAEAFRTGLQNVSKEQKTSGASLGLNEWQIFLFVALPQALSASIPMLCANVIFLIKETSVFSAVALADLVFVTKELIGIYYKTDEALLLLVVFYLIILLPVSLICGRIERRLQYAGYGVSSAI